uniref:Uncharacterized protein n=1 Tax=viral metagenome TaxID=1070528 RepID=A0A6C0KFS4_9ZZZZ|tara:strand:+ start:217 stop:567 length:351 start_codon:yes stop_codon:yes gene_type:complete
MILKDHIHKSFKVIIRIIIKMTDKPKLVIKKLTDDNYKFDKKHKDLFDGLAKLHEQHRKDNFQSWLNSETNDGIIVKNILNRMLQEITNVLKKDGYLIKDEKAFRDYMASYIYRNC